ncbi:cobalt/nickel transport system permease protein [Thermoanaerobacter thermohydrosulfuricus]|uniref:Cobalt/nickel transport system permease protein n=1 Tax=Thermoanaerobacter thermohydrosulfuricus TaxID=1516 RepID=A0A1G7TEM2_THETY|nr:cobalt ECF transporter T component CbiQ [Thermoanaerobacter thermohydrosulfuricus]SDG33685.1 cobalt/nickel transport system permease protein [Thermoanaerobacter thermohydrosulfuricus]
MDNFLEKTILSIQNAFEDMFYSDTISAKKGIMQSLDTRIKLVSVFILLIIVNFGKTIPFMAIFLIYALLLAYFSKIPLKAYVVRVSAVSIFFTGIVLIPSLFNVVKEGQPLVYFTKNFYITKEGLESAIVFMMRSFISLSFVYILALSTKWVEILKALRVFKLPHIFTATLEMALRYIFLLLEIAINMFLARKSRNVGKSDSSEGRKFVASAMANVLIRSQQLSDDVYNAMVSRGYKREYKTITTFKITFYDYIWIGFNITFLSILWYIHP